MQSEFCAAALNSRLTAAELGRLALLFQNVENGFWRQIATQGPSRSFILQPTTSRQVVAYRHVICYPLSACSWLQNKWPWRTLSGYLTSKSVFGQHSVAAKKRHLEPIVQIWMKTDPNNLRQKCSPIILVSGYIRLMGIFAGVPLGGGVKWECGGRRRLYSAI